MQIPCESSRRVAEVIVGDSLVDFDDMVVLGVTTYEATNMGVDIHILAHKQGVRLELEFAECDHRITTARMQDVQELAVEWHKHADFLGHARYNPTHADAFVVLAFFEYCCCYAATSDEDVLAIANIIRAAA